MSARSPVSKRVNGGHDITPTLYLTVEDAARELDAKILIAGSAV
jgi:hypothetical protein